MSGYDYDKLEKLRLNTEIQSFDKVTSVTQNAVNRKFIDLHKVEESIKNLKITEKNKQEEVKMESSMNAPSVQFNLGPKKYSIVFFLAFKEGYFKWYDEFDEEEKKTPVNGWICAFDVDLAFRQLDSLDKSSKIAQIIEKAGLGDPSDYYIMQLLIDFSTADVINYRKELSFMPGLTDKGMSTEQIKQITTAFGKMITEYLMELKFSEDGHPHTIFNIPKWKKPDQLPAPSIQLTDLKFQCYPFKPSDRGDELEGDGQNMLCYIEMTENRKMPHDELSFSSNWVIPLDHVKPDGSVALSRKAFIDGWFLKKLGDRINKSTDLSVGFARILNDGEKFSWNWTRALDEKVDYDFKLHMNDGTPEWRFSHETCMKPDSIKGSSLEVSASVNNTVQFVPGLHGNQTKLVIWGTTEAYALASMKDGKEGAKIWGKFKWGVSFVFTTHSDELDISLLVNDDEAPQSGKDTLPGGDGDIDYSTDPKDLVKSALPKDAFDFMLKAMKYLFLKDWTYFFAGSDVFELRRAMFNNEGDLLLDLYYKK